MVLHCFMEITPVCVAISPNLQRKPINHHHRCLYTEHGDDIHPFSSLFLLLKPLSSFILIFHVAQIIRQVKLAPSH